LSAINVVISSQNAVKSLLKSLGNLPYFPHFLIGCKGCKSSSPKPRSLSFFSLHAVGPYSSPALDADRLHWQY